MSAAELLDHLRRAGVELWADGERLRYDAPEEALTDELLVRLRAHKPELLELVRRHGGRDGGRAAAFTAAPVQRSPLAPAQEGFWLLQAVDPGHAGGNEQFAIYLDGALDRAALERAWCAVLARHPMLRVRFGETGGEPWQEPGTGAVTGFEFHDGRAIAGADPGALTAFASRAICMPFDLRAGEAPLRAVLVRLGEHLHVLLVTVHHIVADGHCVPVIRDDLALAYESARAGHVLPATPAGPQYADLVARAQAPGHAAQAAAKLAFWRERLQGAPVRHALPQRLRPLPAERRSRRVAFEVGPVVAEGLRALARSQGATLFSVLLAALRVLLVRYSGQDDVLISVPVTQRDTPESQRLVACLINNLVFRVSAGGDPLFTGLLARERAGLLEALARRDTPFTRVVQALRPDWRPGEQPLSQILFQFDSAAKPRTGDGVVFRIEPVHAERHSWWDLEWSVTDHGAGAGLSGHLGYALARFEPWLAEAMPAHFVTLLEGIAVDPHRPIAALPLLDAAGRHRVLLEWNMTAADYPAAATLDGLVAERCRRAPQALALICGEERLSYGELERRVATLAARLREHGAAPGDFVALSLPSAAHLVVGLLAILRSGCAVVPLDPAYPRARRAFMLRDSGAQLLLTASAVASDLDAPVARIEVDRCDWSQAVACAESGGEPDSAAFVLYTSGSTGEPKGAVGLHRGAVNRCHWMWHEYGFGPGDVFCLRTSVNFIDSLWEIFGALMHGIPLVVLPGEAARDPALLVPELARHEVTQLVLVPPLLRALLDCAPDLAARLPRLRVIVTSGEPLTPEVLAACRRALPAVRVLNTYGTSEIWDATCFEASAAAPGDRVAIGRPIANMRCYVLDAHLNPLPPGVPGELCVAGVGVGPGYWRRPALTAERFPPDPFATQAGARLYRSGDLARCLPDGNLECLGRMDRQLKLRGFRLEPGEIEAVLRACDGVADAAVVLRGEGDAARLIAYVAGVVPDPDALRAQAAERLPAFMRPAAWVVLERLPLTPSGKVDRDALPEPSAPRRMARECSDPLEARIAARWSQALGGVPVGPDDSFFDLGGQSLLAMRVLARIGADCGAQLTLKDLFAEPTVAALARRIRAAGEASPLPLRPVPRDGVLPLSWGQERLWFLEQLDPASPAYNLAWTIRITGPLDPARLQRALDALVARHEALRTVFPTRDGRPRPEIRATLPVAITVESVEEQHRAGRASALARVPFDLATGPLLRAVLLRGAADAHDLVLVVHHIVTDGTSNAILFRELAALYAGTALPPLPVQYVDYAAWQRDWLEGERSRRQLGYWLERLAGAPPALVLPADWPRPAEQRFRGAWIWRTLAPERAGELRAFARSRGCTLYTLLLAAFKVLLTRYSGQTDLVVGTPVAARPHPDLEGLVGLFVNTVVLRTDAGGDPSFEEFLGRVRTTALDAFAHQDLPFERLVERLKPERSLARAPVFQVMFNLVPIPERTLASGAVGFRLGRLLDHGVSTFDLTLTVGEHAGELELIFEFDTDLFLARTIECMADAYECLIDGLLRHPDTPISGLPLLTPAAAAHSDRALAGARASVPEHETVLSLFAAQVARRAGAVALVGEGRQVTYAELDAEAGRIARRLRVLGCGRDSRVGICLPRGPRLLTALLGVLRAGAAYVPLDPEYPVERLRLMAEDAGLSLVIGAGHALTVPGVPVFDLADDPTRFAAEPGHTPADTVRADDPAYLIYTSGSTGRPKGVVVSHGNLAATFRGWEGVYALGPDDVHLQMASASFDVFAGDWVRALLSGARLVFCPRETLLDPARLYGVLTAERISVAEFVPAVIRVLSAWAGQESCRLPPLRLLIVGSDTWYAHEYRALRAACAAGTRIVNSYGVAEATIDSTWFEYAAEPAADDTRAVPLGQPFPQVALHILDARGRPVPVGVGGELWIGGAGVAAGYHGLDELTAERFVAAGWPGGGRRYRTGDRARWRADGVVEFLGRMDGQLKLRGFRVEPGEVEAALGSIPGVAGCAVGVRETGPGDERLVAWVVAATGAQVEPARLRSALAEQLPGYMVPGEFVVVAQLPLTANGKLDRARLPAPRWGEGSGEVSGRVAPRNALEEALAGLFGEVLGRGVGIHDDFFALGGHSLLATRLIARIRDALEVEVALRELFERPTVAGLAGALGGARLRGSAVERRGGRDEELPLSYPQQRLWFLERLQPGGAAYHLHAAYRLRGELRVEALQRALAAVLARHEALRTVFVERAGEPRQRVLAQLAVAVGVESALGWSEAALGQRLLEWVQQPFDLERGPLLRVQVFECGGAERVLLVVMHHIISDGWSLSVLLRELSAGYAAALAGREPGWAALPVQYGDYAEWQRRELSGARLGEELAWWRAALAGAPTRLDLPTDRPRLPVQRHRGARCFHTLAAADTDRLRALARDAGCTLYMVLLAAFEVVLARYSGAEDFLVGTPVAGRSRTELEGLVGFFVGTLVLRARVAGDPAFGELLGRVKRTALDAYAHAELPFERLVEELQPPRDPGRTPLFQVMFNFHSEPAQLLELYGLEATRIAVTRESSKFDLTASLVEHDGGLHLTFEYDTDLFDGLTVEGMLSGFAGVLRAVGERSQLRVSEVVLSSGAVTERLRRVPAAVPAADARGTLAERLAAQAAATPERTAVVWAQGSWSYGELWPQVQAVAARIVAAAGAGAGRIGLLLGHDGAMVTGLLGTLAAGKSYVPLDAYAPGARNERLIAGAGVQAVVTDAQRLGQAPWLGESALAVVVLDGEDLRVAARDVAAAAAPVDAGSEAYVLYTSGTTGEPQGVVQSQGNVLGQVGLWVRSLGLTAADRLSLFSGYGYDAAVQDLFGALLTGASVHLYDLRGAQSAPELIDRIAAERVSVLHLTPTVYRHLFGGRVTCTQDLSAVRLVVLGGEPARRSDLELFKVRFRRGARLVNGLGLTESTMGLQFVADHDTRVLGEGLPVGRAVAGVEARLLDAQGREGGWRGELALVGEYITPGYLGDAGRTARRLRRLADGRVLLRTGDLVRRLPDGELLHVGRVDRQVQIRGMRVEPAELEAALGALLPGSECAVVARADPAGEPMLVAYLTGTECGDEAALRAGLRARLPEYLLPSALVWLAALPRRANGKLDEGALPAPQAPAAGAALPRDERERRLAQLWGELLGRERIGVHDDFFALGGHSLLATRLIARLRDAFAVELPLIALFEHPTVAALAAAIERTAARPAAPGLPAPRRRPRNAAGGG